MTKKEQKQKIDLKSWIMAGCAMIALAIVITMIIILNQNEEIESDYFRSDDTKIVLTMDKETAALDDSEWEPEITHMVYYYDGNKITGAKAFYEYDDAAEAKEAYDNLGVGEFSESKKLNGRFVVFVIKKRQYDGMTVEELKENIELLKQIDALILDYNETL